MFQDFAKWLDRILAEGLPEAAAINFNLYEDHDNHWSIQLIAAERYDEEDSDWACEEVFTTGEDLFTWQEACEWEKVLCTGKELVMQYLNEGQFSELLKSFQAVAVGFVDGDLEILYQK